jgi:hypothetical protein
VIIRDLANKRFKFRNRVAEVERVGPSFVEGRSFFRLFAVKQIEPILSIGARS